jgi:hypothetical protein
VLVQAGSEVDTFSTAPYYYAWYELYPDQPVIQRVPFNIMTIHPGDTMFVNINASLHQSNIFIEDVTTGVSYSVPSNLTANGCSCATAEGVEENTQLTDTGLLTFHNPVNFTGVTAADINGSKYIGSFPLDNFTITDPNNNTLAYLKNGLSGIGSTGNYEIDRAAFDNAPPPVLTDDWTGANNSTWNSTKWVSTTNDSSRTVDIQGNQGRLTVSNASARATGQMTSVADSEATITYKFNENTSGSFLRLYQRASGATGANQMPNAYRLEIGSNSTTIKLQKFVNSVVTQIGWFNYTSGTAAQRVRFRVQGSTIEAKVWALGTSEPVGWSVVTTDTAVTGTGVLQVAHSYTSGTHTVYVDDLSVYKL